MNLKPWKIKDLDKNLVKNIATEYGLPVITSMLLSQRVNFEDEDVESFIFGRDLEESPFEMIDMDKAVDRIKKAIDKFEFIAIYGDYDADGITATSILYEYLDAVGANVMYYIPNREAEGYGMKKEAIKKLNEYEVKLIITVDNGISSIEETQFAKELGIDVVITDHHMPHNKIPEAVAVVDPHREDCPSVFKDYCGAGIALKLVMALECDLGEENDVMDRFADLACIGTIADIMPVTGENRKIIKRGIELLNSSDRIGVCNLLESSGVETVNSVSMAFSVVPRINSSGRMGVADRAVKLLTTQDEEEASAFCEDICSDNDTRKNIENSILELAVFQIENDPKLKYSRVLVVHGEDWHIGVIGIVAARIVEKYNKPCIVLSRNKDISKGSARSVEGFPILEAIRYAGDTLLKFGGHPMAAGVTLETSKIQEFKDKIEEFSKNNFDKMPRAEVILDLKLLPNTLTTDLPSQVNMLEPFGKGNESPLYGLYSMKLLSIKAVGAKSNHLRLEFGRDDKKITAMYFFCTPDDFMYKVGDVLDLAVKIDTKIYNGYESLSIIIKTIKMNSLNIEEQCDYYNIYEKYRRRECLSRYDISQICPKRDDIAIIYRYIRKLQDGKIALIQILNDLQTDKINLGKILVSFDAMRECQLAEIEGDDILSIKLIPTENKVDIMNSKTIKSLEGLQKD